MPKRKSGIKRSFPEHDLQCAYISWFKMQYKNLLCFAVPNGARRSPRLGAWLKAEGLVAGVSDIIVLYPNGDKYLLLLEFKIRPNKPTQAQTDFMTYAMSHNYSCAVVYTLEDAISVTKEYLKDYNARPQATPGINN